MPSADWKGCRVTYDRDDPSEWCAWEFSFLDAQGRTHDLPQALVELLIEDYYDEILRAIDG